MLCRKVSSRNLLSLRHLRVESLEFRRVLCGPHEAMEPVEQPDLGEVEVSFFESYRHADPLEQTEGDPVTPEDPHVDPLEDEGIDPQSQPQTVRGPNADPNVEPLDKKGAGPQTQKDPHVDPLEKEGIDPKTPTVPRQGNSPQTLAPRQELFADWVDNLEEFVVNDCLCFIPELAGKASEAGEYEIVYHYSGQTHKHTVEDSTASGQELIDKLKELDRKGAIVDSIKILGHGGDHATNRGRSITICEDDTIKINTLRVKDGRIERGDFITITGVGENNEDVDITDLLKRIVARSPNIKITLAACYGGENGTKIGQKLANILGVNVEAYTGALKFIPGVNWTMGWLGAGRWVTLTPQKK